MATRRSLRSSSINSSKPPFPNNCSICGKTHIQQNKKDILAKRIFTLLAEATVKSAAKDKMCDFYFQNKVIESSLFCSSLARFNLCSKFDQILILIFPIFYHLFGYKIALYRN